MIKENELTRTYFPFLDGLRAIAILWVLLHHLPIALPAWLEPIRLRGDLGVELFFSISSFLVFRSLHQCLLKNKNDRFEFLKRRVFRILPPYMLILGLIAALSFIDHGLKEKLVSIKTILPSFPLFYYNYARFASEGTVPGSMNIFWSLCFEEQFYLSLFLISLFSVRRIQWFIVAGILFSISLRLFYFSQNISLHPHALQMQTHLRMDAILLGCFFYFYWDKIKPFFNNIVLSLFLVLAAVYFHNTYGPLYQGLVYILITLSFTFFIFNLLANTKSVAARLLQNKVLTEIGVVSFEVYLLHEIVIGVAVKAGLKNSPIIFTTAVILVSVMAAFLMHRLFSRPLNNYLRGKYL